jgi:RNA polymerase-associated protein
MSNAASRRSTMTLFSHSNNIYSHQVRIVLAEKGVQYDLVEVEPNKECLELLDYNPYGLLPTLQPTSTATATRSMASMSRTTTAPVNQLTDSLPPSREKSLAWLWSIVMYGPVALQMKSALAPSVVS